MRLDIRIPLGLLFMILGALLAIFGAFSNPQLYERSLNVNLNLWWGSVLVAFGALMLVLGYMGQTRAKKEAGSRGAETTSQAASPQ
jgi:hypothetical protein